MLKNNNIECYKTDCLWIFEECFKLELKDLIIRGNDIAPSEQVKPFFEMINLRLKGLPVQYIIGHCEFMGIDLKVGEGVLIPRDDTEVLVRQVIKKLKKLEKNLKILDLCSGTGAIALAIKNTLGKKVDVAALELSDLALDYLKVNSEKNNLDIEVIKEDIASGYKHFVDGTIECIISNPPYIPTNDIENLQREVKFEPSMALDGGTDGLNFYRVICNKWLSKLSKDGFIAVEIGAGQSGNVCNIFKANNLESVEIHKDMNGIDRVVIAHMPHF